MKVCPYCGKENDDRNEACERCFAGLPEKEEKTKKDNKNKESE